MVAVLRGVGEGARGMPTTASPRLQQVRQQLDDLDALLERMLALPLDAPAPSQPKLHLPPDPLTQTLDQASETPAPTLLFVPAPQEPPVTEPQPKEELAILTFPESSAPGSAALHPGLFSVVKESPPTDHEIKPRLERSATRGEAEEPASQT